MFLPEMPSSNGAFPPLLVLLQILPLLLFKSANACASTSVTTTPNCALCSADQFTLTPGDGVTSTTPTVAGITTDAMGCEHIMVTCTAVAGGMTFMQFNVNQGGPINPTGTQVTATLDCVGGQWVYQQAGIARVINEVNCQNT